MSWCCQTLRLCCPQLTGPSWLCEPGVCLFWKGGCYKHPNSLFLPSALDNLKSCSLLPHRALSTVSSHCHSAIWVLGGSVEGGITQRLGSACGAVFYLLLLAVSVAELGEAHLACPQRARLAQRRTCVCHRGLVGCHPWGVRHRGKSWLCGQLWQAVPWSAHTCLRSCMVALHCVQVMALVL